jgi:hypothetical protein
MLLIVFLNQVMMLLWLSPHGRFVKRGKDGFPTNVNLRSALQTQTAAKG